MHRGLFLNLNLLVVALLSLYASPFLRGYQDDRAELIELIESGDYEEAGDWLDEEKGRWPLLRARLLVETGRAAEAIEVLTSLPPDFAQDPAARIIVAGVHQSAGRLEKAEEILRDILEGDRKNIEALTRLGEGLISSGKRLEGRAWLNKVISIYQDLTVAQAEALPPIDYVWMGRACEGLGRLREAYEVMYSSAFDLDEDLVEAHVAAGWAMLRAYNAPDSRSHFKDALARNRNHAEANVGMARAIWWDYRYPRDRLRDTQRHLSVAGRTWPGHPGIHLIRGDIAFSSENWPAAEKFYLQAIEANPSALRAKGLLAALYYSIARLEDFQTLVREVEGAHPAPAEFFATIAERLVDRFFYDEATEYSRKAISIDPDYSKAYPILGINALRVGLEESGRLWLDEANDRDPFNVWVHNTRRLIKHIDENFTEVATDDFIVRMRKDEAPFLVPYLAPLLHETKVDLEGSYAHETTRPITVEDFSEHAFFSARSIGLPGLAASGVCFGKLVTLTTPRAIPGNWGVVAVHEFAHVVTLQKAGHRIPRWFGEGLSVFEEGRREPRWKRHYADEFVTALAAGELHPLKEMQAGFVRPSFPGEILLAYYHGGVLCSFIEDEWGHEGILRLLTAYRNGRSTEEAVKEALEVDVDEFDRRAFAFCGKLAGYFGIGPFFSARHIMRLREITDSSGADAGAWIDLALAYSNSRGRIADAELAIGKAEKISPDSADLAAVKGLIALRSNKRRTAEKEFRKAIEGDSRWKYRSGVALATILADRDENEEAIGLLREAIAIHPDGTRSRFGHPGPYRLLADLLDDLGQRDEAIATMIEQVSRDRDDFGSRLKLAKIFDGDQEWQKVIDVAWDAPFINPYDSEAHFLLGRAYIEVGSFKLALRELEVQLESDSPPLAQIYPDLAWVHWKLGKDKSALDFARRALRLDPTSKRARTVLEALDGDS